MIPARGCEFAEALAQKGKDAEALVEYLWCFDHGLEASPAFSGVRLSFLLSNIKNLAAHYPPAGKALEGRRDESQAKVAAGSTDFHTIQDLVSLNKTLGQEEKNLAVFDQLPAGSKTREIISHLLTEQLLQAKRYADVLMGADGASAFRQKVDQFNSLLDSLGKDSPIRVRMEATLRQMTIRAGANYFEALAGLKRDQDAKDLAGQILKFDSSQGTRDCLAQAAQRAGNADLGQFVKQ